LNKRTSIEIIIARWEDTPLYFYIASHTSLLFRNIENTKIHAVHGSSYFRFRFFVMEYAPD